MQKRQSSCLNCRTRKIKCDRKDPCSRCVKNNNSSCIYPRQGTLGRPPKNAVFHGKVKTNGARQMVIREFIFEHVNNDANSNSLSICNKNKTNNNNNSNSNSNNKRKYITSGFFIDSEWWILSKEAVKDHNYLNTYFQTIYWFYVKRGLAIKERFDTATYQLPEKPRLKFNNLQLLFTWWTSMSVNLLIKRACKLRLETCHVPSLTLYMFQMNDNYSNTPQQRSTYPTHIVPLPIPNTLTSSPPIPHLSPKYKYDAQSNPLRSLPPDQAINLINDFFLVHPHSILINKAKLMKDYWADTANPLLLTVIYGTTQCFSQILQGIPVLLWESDTETNRNPFLNYAHTLLQTLPTTPSVTAYKSTVMLALFEVIWGHSKVGMSLLATSYLMGTQLGLWDNSFKAVDPIEDELVNMTFWSVFRATTHGCMEMGTSIVDSLVYHQLRFPPMNIYESDSYQYDALHNNINDIRRHTYLIESFYSGSVVTHFSGILYACLPKPYVNVYGIPTDDSIFKGSEQLSMLRNINDVETRVHTVLDGFAQFIQQHRLKWSTIQLYTIETSYRLYRIHFRFLQSTYTCGQRKYQEDLIPTAPTFDTATKQQEEENADDHFSFMLDPANPAIAKRLKQSKDYLIAMVDELEYILRIDSNNSGSRTPFKSTNQTTLLPHGLMVAAFETSTQLLMLNYQLEPSQHVYDTMAKLLDIGKLQDTYQASSLSMKNVRQRLKVFMKQHQTATTGTTTTTTSKQRHSSSSSAHPIPSQQIDDIDNSLFQLNSNVEMQRLFFLQSSEIFQSHQPMLGASIPTSLPSSSPHSSMSYHETPLDSSPSSSSEGMHLLESYTTTDTRYADIMSMMESSPMAIVQPQQQKIVHPSQQLIDRQDVDYRYQGTMEEQPWNDSSLIDWDSVVVQELPCYDLLSFLDRNQSFTGFTPF